MTHLLRYLVIFLSLSLWGWSLTLPGYVSNRYPSESHPIFYSVICHLFPAETPEKCLRAFVNPHPQPHIPTSSPTVTYGYEILELGWLAVPFQPGWLANVFFVAALFFIATKRDKRGVQISSLAVLCALAAVIGKRTFAADEGGVAEWVIEYFTVGYYAWLSALTVPLIYSFLQYQGQQTLRESLTNLLPKRRPSVPQPANSPASTT